jgi:hypothetical protein
MRIVALVLVLIFASSVLAPELAEAETVALSVSPADLVVEPGASFSVTVRQDSAVATTAVEFDFTFDRTRLHVTDVVPAAAYASAATLFIGVAPQTEAEALADANDTTGVLNNVAVIKDYGASVPAGTAEAIVITLQALPGAAGVAEMSIEDPIALDGAYYELELTTAPGAVRFLQTVTMRPTAQGNYAQWTPGGGPPLPHYTYIDESGPSSDGEDVLRQWEWYGFYADSHLFAPAQALPSGSVIDAIRYAVRWRTMPDVELGGSNDLWPFFGTFPLLIGPQYSQGYFAPWRTDVWTLPQVNPETSAGWTYQDVNAGLYFGFRSTFGFIVNEVTQAYVEVTYYSSGPPN